MGYAHPEFKMTINLGLMDVVTNAGAITLKGPKGKTGRLREIAVAGQTLCTAVTLSPILKIGTVATPAAYGILTLGALAAGANMEASTISGGIVTGIGLPADTDFQIKLEAPTGGTPAGKIYPVITIDWF